MSGFAGCERKLWERSRILQSARTLNVDEGIRQFPVVHPANPLIPLLELPTCVPRSLSRRRAYQPEDEQQDNRPDERDEDRTGQASER